MPNLSTKNESLLHRWVTGELTRREEAELEALAREDDFLAEALAGLRRDPELNHAALVGRLRERLEQRETRKKSFVWQSLAAAMLLLLVAGAGFWLLDRPLASARAELAEARPEPATEADVAPEADPAESASPPPTDRPVIAERDPTPPAPRRAVAKAATPTEEAAPEPVPVSPPVSRNVPSAVLPEAYADVPPPPPNPATAGLTSRGAPGAPPAAVPSPPRAAAPTEHSAAPVPYSIGAQSIAADTPNGVPTEDGKLSAAFAESGAGAAQPVAGAARKISGYARDSEGEPLVGAMVTTPGVPVGVFTDSEGYFELRIDRNVDRLIFRNTGYKDAEIALAGNDNHVEVTLDEDVIQSIATEEVFAKTTVIPNDGPTLVTPPGGHGTLRRQLRQEKPAGLPAGRVRLEFTVTQAGQLRRFQVLETPDPRLSQWLMERLRQTGDWKFLHGEGPYTVRYSIKFD